MIVINSNVTIILRTLMAVSDSYTNDNVNDDPIDTVDYYASRRR